ncbi:hypothetical protein JKF63_04155 [Porcisia hertigi]|uniref:Uncharacterized protein n=1 Tax=Porcisia hertigi TaxID=2761500 RepID=A0A836IDV1_9TRYP|nr:hypothetical protein JKF63_04155 [Porcisia hertigi]
MSDSEWEVLSVSDEQQVAQPLQPLPTDSTGTAEEAAAEGKAENVACDSVSQVSRQGMLIPLCLTLNQTGTRIGVGHTRGFLVFRVVAAPAADAACEGVETEATPATSSASSWTRMGKKESAKPAHSVGAKTAEALSTSPARSQLVLDPQYNLDLLTFSNIREHMRQERAARTAFSMPAKSTMADAPSSSLPAVVTDRTAGNPHGSRHAPALEASPPSPSDEVVSEEDRDLSTDSEERLGSFLTTVDRALAQIKRDRQGLRVRHNRAVTEKPSLHQQQQDKEATTNTEHTAAASAVVAERSTSAAEDSRIAGGTAPAETLCMGDAAPTSRCRRLPLKSSLALERGNDENINLEPLCSDANSNHDTAPAVMQRADTSLPSSSTSLASSVASGLREHDDDEENEDEDDCIGFEGGGVAVMAFLYEQTWMALVGGGPTPMGEPNRVQFIRDGELQHRLLMPDPVVHLFLDARLLFVVTTTELRMYTNPIEQEWTCLRQTLPLPAAVATRYTIAAPSAAAAANAPVRVWEKLPNPGSASSSANVAAASNAAEELRGSCATPVVAASLPVIPVVVDYARSLVLLPTGEGGNGFALHRYVSGPEVRYPNPVRTTDMDTLVGSLGTECASKAENHFSTGSTAVATGRTTCFLQQIATKPTAHRNPLYNLALYVGWPSSITRLLSSETETGKGNQRSDSTRCSSLDGTNSGGIVTLVAASSEYATRLTLWILQRLQNETASQPDGHPPLSFAAATGEAAFVLLREFRVGVRLTAPQAVVMSFPGVSRYVARSHTTLAATSARASTEGSDGRARAASWTNAGLLRNRTIAGETAMPPSADTSASASGICSAATSYSSFMSDTAAMTSWATGAAAAVGSSKTEAVAVQHLQFVGNGAYLLCIHDTDIISIFSTSARETAQEAKNMCRDRVAAEHNRYSRLSIMNKYLPQVLSNRLEAYTRQAWPSCTGRLPSTDPTFLPRWICAQRRGMPGGTRNLAVTVPTAAPKRLTSMAGPTPPTAAAATLPPDNVRADVLAGAEEVEPNASTLSSGSNPPNRARSSRASAAKQLKSTGAPLAFPTGSSDEQLPLASRCVWGTPFTKLSQCIQVWSSTSHSGCGAAPMSSGTTPATSSSRHSPPIVLNCATCEGTFANILLYAEEGEVHASRALRYATA